MTSKKGVGDDLSSFSAANVRDLLRGRVLAPSKALPAANDPALATLAKHLNTCKRMVQMRAHEKSPRNPRRRLAAALRELADVLPTLIADCQKAAALANNEEWPTSI